VSPPASIIPWPSGRADTNAVNKKKSNVVIEDLFGDDAFLEGDLIKDETTTAAKSLDPKKKAVSLTTRVQKKIPLAIRRKLSPEELTKRFEATVKHMEPRIGRNPSVAHPLVRKRTFLTLLDIARSEEHVRKILDLIPRYREARGDLHPSFAVAFTRKSISPIIMTNVGLIPSFQKDAVKNSDALS